MSRRAMWREEALKARSMKCIGTLTCITRNSDGSRAAAGGSAVLQLVTIQQNALGTWDLKEGPNLCSNSRQYKRYKINDLKWNPMQEHILASGSTDGSLALWFIDRARPDYTYAQVGRTINRMDWKADHSEILATCTQGEGISLWDMRDRSRARPSGTDVGRESLAAPVRKFNSTESVRDLAFASCRSNGSLLGAVDGSGQLRIFDIRAEHTPLIQVRAHSKCGVTLDWHPTEANVLVTSGLDDNNMVLWDISQSPIRRIRTVHSTSSSSNISWRRLADTSMDEGFELACAALVVETRVQIWDFRQLLWPKSLLPSYNKEIITGLDWCADGTHLVHCSKDGYICLAGPTSPRSVTDDTPKRPFSLSPTGDMAMLVNAECSEAGFHTCNFVDVDARTGPRIRPIHVESVTDQGGRAKSVSELRSTPEARDGLIETIRSNEDLARKEGSQASASVWNALSILVEPLPDGETDEGSLVTRDFATGAAALLAASGDVENALSIALLLGVEASPLWPRPMLARSTYTYIEKMLRLRRPHDAVEAMSRSSLEEIRRINRLNTQVTYQLAHRRFPQCPVCRHSVQGLWTWCQGCGHGTHLPCAKRWFSDENLLRCPTPQCPHQCIRSSKPT